MKRPPLRRIRLHNFKAVRDSGGVELGWLTAFIGNNGSGKSSLIEGLETFRDIVLDGLDSAMSRWRGFEHIWNHAVSHELRRPQDHRPHHTNPLDIWLQLAADRAGGRCEQRINLGEGGNELFIEREQAWFPGPNGLEHHTRDAFGQVLTDNKPRSRARRLSDGASFLKELLGEELERWQFLTLVPGTMGHPVPQQRAGGRVQLAKDGSNVAEYLHEIRKLDLEAFNGILESLRFVLPYATDLQPTLVSELERAFYLKLREEKFEVPGWLLSTGTLRLVALLACLRHPKPPPLLVIEEIENGLDPRTIHLIVEEIRAVIEARTTQVILTTHSPYLLDLLDISHIVVVERQNGEPRFHRPDAAELAEWSQSFSPGRLYTMGRLSRGGK